MSAKQKIVRSRGLSNAWIGAIKILFIITIITITIIIIVIIIIIIIIIIITIITIIITKSCYLCLVLRCLPSFITIPLY